MSALNRLRSASRCPAIRRRWIYPSVAVLALVGLWIVSATPLTVGSASAAPTQSPQCADQFSSHRDPANPLMLQPAPPASDPLRGARFFVDGPAHGAAAGAILSRLGLGQLPIGGLVGIAADAESWVSFAAQLPRLLSLVSPTVAYEVRMLEKVASQPEAQRISSFSQGGTPTGIYSQTQKLFCHNLTADPGTIPIISTYFMHPTLGGCPTTSQIDAYAPTFMAQIDALARATGNRPAVYLVELDAIGSSACIARNHALPAWEALLRYEGTTLAALPHTVVYLEGGYSDSNTARYAARVLNASGIRHVQGFFTNDTHINWTIDEIRYGQQISRLTHGAHFIVNTAQNGNGPKLNPHPATEGVEDLCNPPGRGLGPTDNTSPGFAHLDALLWTHVPGNSSGSCNGGPPPGIFWPDRAISLAAHANGQLGPHYPAQPY